MAAQNRRRIEPFQLPAGRPESKERMDGEWFVPRAVVGRRSEGVAADEHAPLRPPKRDLPPRAPRADGDELEWADRLARNGVVANAEPLG